MGADILTGATAPVFLRKGGWVCARVRKIMTTTERVFLRTPALAMQTK